MNSKETVESIEVNTDIVKDISYDKNTHYIYYKDIKISIRMNPLIEHLANLKNKCIHLENISVEISDINVNFFWNWFKDIKSYNDENIYLMTHISEILQIGKYLAFYNMRSDSELEPLIIWDTEIKEKYILNKEHEYYDDGRTKLRYLKRKGWKAISEIFEPKDYLFLNTIPWTKIKSFLEYFDLFSHKIFDDDYESQIIEKLPSDFTKEEFFDEHYLALL